MGSMGGDNYQWPQQQGMNGSQGTNPMSIDTNLSNTRSMPATPATTPPGSSIQSMPSAYPPVSQPYDNSRAYSAQPLQSPYQTANTSPQDRPIYSSQGTYVKSEMGPPPSSRASISGVSGESDAKSANGYPSQGNDHGSQGGHEEEADHEHEAEYTHDRGTYDSSNSQYNYSAQPLPSLQPEHPHLSPEMGGSAGHQGASGRSTPRSAAPPAAYYQSGYSTPPRGAQQQPGMYNVVSNDRGPANGSAGSDMYGSQTDVSSSMQNGYASAPSNGIKRSRDDEDERSLSGGPGMDMKRRKTLALDTPPVYQPAPALAAPTRRR